MMILGRAGIVSPIWSWFLLTQVSGVPLLARTNNKKWGDFPEWGKFLASTWPVLPKLW